MLLHYLSCCEKFDEDQGVVSQSRISELAKLYFLYKKLSCIIELYHKT